MPTFSLTTRRFQACILITVGQMVFAGHRAAAAEPTATTPAELKHLKYRSIGPAAGGRICRVAGVPRDSRIYYAGTAAGGAWKSTVGVNSGKPGSDDGIRPPVGF